MIKVDQYQLIRELYVGEGLSQREIARRLGISRSTMRKYCRGEVFPFQKSMRQPKQPLFIVETRKATKTQLISIDGNKSLCRCSLHVSE